MRPNRIARLVALVAVLATAPALAQVYKWVDENGRTHYGEKPPANKGAPVNLRDPTGGPRPEPEPKGEEEKDAPVAGFPPTPPAKPAKPPRARPRETELQRQEREFQERQQQRELSAAEERQRQQGTSSPNTSDCRQARNDVLIMDRFSTSYTFAQRSEAQARVSRYCR